MTYRPSNEERQLLAEYAELTSSRKALAWTVGVLVVASLFLMPVGLLMWGVAGVLGVITAKMTSRRHSVAGHLARLRTLPNPKTIGPGAIVSLLPDPTGLSGDPLVGCVGSFSDDYGDAEILSEPLGGTQWVRKVQGSFRIARGDWVRFHQEEDGTLCIFEWATSYGELIPQDRPPGNGRESRLAELHRLTVAQDRAAAALQELRDATEAASGTAGVDAQQQDDNDYEEYEEDEDSEWYDKDYEDQDDEKDEEERVWTKDDIISYYGITEHYFTIKYMSYGVALRASGKSSHWNDDIDAVATSRGALTHREIELAQTDFSQAVTNRVKLALAMMGAEPGNE